jgi:exopolyphosphatase/guanosine-5'-triphosphate,3'-diphosphate pyrophosphatase
LKLAAIDLGSNAARLLVVRVTEKTGSKADWKALEYLRVPLRLGDDVFVHGRVGEARSSQLLATMQGFAHLIRAFEVDYAMACATSALREASNGSVLADEINAATGLNLEIVSGSQEAELLYLAHRSLAGPNDRIMTMDVGGGSTEISLMQGENLVISRSFSLGAVRILDGTDRDQDWKELKEFLKKQVIPHNPTHFLGSGGNINKIFDLLKTKKGEPVPFKILEKLHEHLSALTLNERIKEFALNEDRADVIVPACRLFLWVMKHGNLARLTNSKLGLKEGIVMALMNRVMGSEMPSIHHWAPGPLSDTTRLSTAE